MKTRSLVRLRQLVFLSLMAIVMSSGSGWADQLTNSLVNQIAQVLGVPVSDIFIKSATALGGQSGDGTYANTNYKYSDTDAVAKAMAALVSGYDPTSLMTVTVTVNNTAHSLLGFPCPMLYNAYVTIAGVQQNPKLVGSIAAAGSVALRFTINTYAWNGPVVFWITPTKVSHDETIQEQLMQYALPPAGLTVTLR